MSIDLLEKAIGKVRELPEEEQEAVAAVMLQMAGAGAPVVRLDNESRAAIREGLRQAESGEFVPDEIVAEANKRHGL
jgi:predicted transcriptional regulator